MKISYDIRGKYPEEINENFLIKILNNLPGDKIVLGFDSRKSSKELAESVRRNIDKINKEILWLDLSTTPLTSFAGKLYNVISLMITASHLGNQYNGFKISENGYAWKKEEYLELLNKIKYNTNKKNEIVNNKKGNIIYIREKVLEEYKKWLNFPLDNIKNIFLKNKENNPGVKLLKDLGIDVSINPRANFEFDSDCDRLYVYKDEIELHRDLVGIILAKYLTKPGDHVIFNVGTSVLVYEELKDRNLEMVRTGRNFMIEAMKGAKFGFEYSGHYYFYNKNFDYYLDDGVKALLEILKIKDFFREYEKLVKKTNISEEYRVNGTIEKFSPLINKIKNYANNLIDIDGFRFEFLNDNKLEGFYLIRQSNTEDKVSIRFEHRDKIMFEELKNITENFLSSL